MLFCWQAAEAHGDAELDDFDFEQTRSLSGMQEVLAAAKGCLNADGSTDNCDLVSAYNTATGTPDSTARRATGTDSTVARQRSSSSAANLLVKQNLRACGGSTGVDGAARNSSEVQSCASSKDNSTFGALANATRKESTIRAMQRDLAAEKMQVCMSASNSTTEKCTAQAKLTHQSYSAENVTDLDVQDALLVYRSDMYSTVWQQCNSSNSPSFSACMSSANAAATAAGGALTAQWAQINLNALRQSAEWWCSCRETGVSDTECRNSSYSVYESVGGDVYEWTSKDMDHAEALATSICSGDMTQLVRTGFVHHVSEFAVSCSELDTRQILLDIQKAIQQVDAALVVEFELAAQAYVDGVCSIKAAIHLEKSTLPLEDIITAVTAISVAAEIKAGSIRRIGSFINAAIFAAEEVLECSSLVMFPLLVRMSSSMRCLHCHFPLIHWAFTGYYCWCSVLPVLMPQLLSHVGLLVE